MRIAILGCGWLGLDLAKKFVSDHHVVRGSVTRVDKMNALRNSGIVPYSIKLYEEGIQGDITSFLNGMDVLIIDVPPGLRRNPEINFVKKIRNLVPKIEKSKLKRLVFISSTSVYRDTEDFPMYSETAETDDSNVAVQLKKAEDLLLENPNFDTSVIRFGGLIGKDRHPVTHLAGRTGISNPEAPTNLIHKEDCISIIDILISKTDNSIWNAVYPEHPTKEEYYSATAAERGLEKPDFDHSKKSIGKKISSKKLQNELKFKFKRSITA